MPWRETTVGEIVDFYDNKRIPLNSTERAVRKGSYPYYGASGVVDYIDGYVFDGRYLLVAEDGENLNSRKLPVAFFARGRFWVNNHAHVVRGKEGVCDDAFLKHWFANANISGYVTGAAQPKLSQSSLRRIEIRLPDYRGQVQISCILSAYDDLIENNTRRIEILEEMARRLYENWFVQFRFPGHERVELKESELGPIPEGWKVSALDEFGEIITGKTPSKNRSEFFGGSAPFIKLPDMHNNTFIIETNEKLSQEGVDSQKTKTIPPGSICVSCIGTAGVVVITSEPSQTNQQINSIVPRAPELREFLFFATTLLKDKINNYGATGATMTNLSRGKFSSLQVVEPKEDLLCDYNKLAAPFFDKVLCLQKTNRNLRAQRDLLLPKLISGEIEVSDIPMPT